jgi:hypothetical protein
MKSLRESNAQVALRLVCPIQGTYARALLWMNSGRGGESPRQGLGSNNNYNEINKIKKCLGRLCAAYFFVGCI